MKGLLVVAGLLVAIGIALWWPFVTEEPTRTEIYPNVWTMPSCSRIDPLTGFALAYWPPRVDGVCHVEDDPGFKRGRAL